MTASSTQDLNALLDDAIAAARQGNQQALGTLLDAGVNINSTSARGDSLLTLACYNARVEVAQWLVKKGADVNICNTNGQTALMGVSFKGFMPIAEMLINHGADVNVADASGKTALMFAASFEHINILQLLISHGADIFAKDNNGDDLLTLSEKNLARRSIPVVKSLLAASTHGG